MTPPTTVDTLLDILELIDRIERQIAGAAREVFTADHDILDAPAYRILAIGESCRGNDDDLRARYPHVPWRQILAMRSFLAHGPRSASLVQSRFETEASDLISPSEALRPSLTDESKRRSPRCSK